MKNLAKDIGLIALAGFVALAITAVGQGVWGVMAMANIKVSPGIPWAAVVMPIILFGLGYILTGRGWPKAGAATRRAFTPFAKVSAPAWTWSVVGGVTGVLACAALWSILTSIVRTPPNVLPDTRGIPMITVVPMLLIAIVAAPLTEEIAFRGYAMGLLRRRFGPISTLVISALLFATAHLTQGLYATKLVVYVLVGLGLGVVAWRTRSLLPAMIVHSFGDFTFFTMVWTHDAGRRLISDGGADGWFYANVALLLVATPICLWAYRQLFKVTADGRTGTLSVPANATPMPA